MENRTGTAAGFGVGGFLLGMLAGAVVGGITALLLTPRSGPETMQMVKDRMSQMQDIVRSRARDESQAMERQTG